MIDLNKLTAEKRLTSLEEEIFKYFVEHIDTVQEMGVRALAKATFTSPASVIRLSKKLGYTGFTDMYYSLLPIIKKAEYSSVDSEETILRNDFKHRFKINYKKLLNRDDATIYR
ncbi:hypothetical protein VXN63_07145 [Marinilactibacillus sp. XAAS-LB27]|uniref:MurR/RpiR family transcriptional regulator n=1 Tax=Marinilactibacillus sp. XAAS-LB27 TaxID=3114538 RepID=UPI002E187855|nr:hypothetical protein [Marinilactibacillus sp. XAAS-LB27]